MCPFFFSSRSSILLNRLYATHRLRRSTYSYSLRRKKVKRNYKWTCNEEERKCSCFTHVTCIFDANGWFLSRHHRDNGDTFDKRLPLFVRLFFYLFLLLGRCLVPKTNTRTLRHHRAMVRQDERKRKKMKMATEKPPAKSTKKTCSLRRRWSTHKTTLQWSGFGIWLNKTCLRFEFQNPKWHSTVARTKYLISVELFHSRVPVHHQRMVVVVTVRAARPSLPL